MARTGRSPFDNNPLRRRLAALRRRLQFVVTTRGIGWLLALVLLTAVVAGALDCAWHLPPLVRGFLLVAILSGAGLVGLLFLLRPLLGRMDDLTLALRIEERYPSLNDSLASTIQFLEQAEKKVLGEDTGPAVKDSLAMRREAARRAMQNADGCDFNRIIDTRGLRTAGTTGIAALILTGVLCWLYPARAATALSRLIDPFGAHAWPTATTIDLAEYRKRIGKSDAFEVRGQLRGVLPANAQIILRQDGGSPEAHEVKVIREKDGHGRFQATLRPAEKTRSFTFQVKANDAATDRFKVDVAPPPVLTALQAHLFFPDYTGLSPLSLPTGSGDVEAIAGTAVSLTASASSPLSEAWLEYTSQTSLAGILSPLAADGLPGFLVASAAGFDLAQKHPVHLSEDRKSFRVRFHPWVSGAYSLRFVDLTGLGNVRTYQLRIRPDPAPVVALERPSALRESLEVLPSATLPLRVTAEDPLYGIRAIWLEYRTQTDLPFRRLPLFDPALVARNEAVKMAAPAVPALARRQRPTQHLIEGRLPLSQLRHPDGSSPREGDVITLRARADDHDNVSLDKQPGSSTEVVIRVVTRAALEVALNTDQARIQKDLLELRQMERDAHRKVNEIENRVLRTKTLSPDDRSEIAHAAETQKQIRERLETQGQESVRGRVERILDTLRQNEMNNSAVKVRMEAVERELDRLAREELQQIEASLAEARKQADGTDDRSDPGAKALENLAEKTARQARELEQLAAEKGRDENDRARLAEEAKNLKQQANRLRELAREAPGSEARAQERSREMERLAQERERLSRELEQAAARDQTGKENELLRQAREQRDAARTLREQARNQVEPQKKERGDVKASLTEARRRQEEVDKTLSDLLQRMEPWSTTREVKTEARSILEEQRRQMDEVEAMQQQGLSKDREQLTPEQRARIDNAQSNQQKLRERTQQMTDKMRRLSEERKTSDPATAEEMKRALEQVQDSDVESKMQIAKQKLEANQLGEAAKEQRRALEELEKLVKNMEDRREAELARNIGDLKKVERKLEELADEQDRLNKKVKEAEKIADPKKREEELKRLGAKQKEIQEKTQEASRQLSRMQAQRASETAGQAAKQMEEAVKRLERGEPPVEQQEEALDRLDEAAEDAGKTRNNSEEELAREQLGKVADTIKRLKERHDRLVSETSRLHREAQERKAWERDLVIGSGGLGDLAESQKLLGEETRGVAERDLGGAEVFSRQLARAAEAMQKAAESLAAHLEKVRMKPDDLAAPVESERLQKQAQRRLQGLLDALKMDDGEQARQQRGAQRGGQGRQGGQGGQSGRAGDGIPPLAQLKLLRSMQAEVNDRTRELADKQRNPAKLSDAEKQELQSLQREQRTIADLIEEFSRPEKDEGEKK